MGLSFSDRVKLAKGLPLSSPKETVEASKLEVIDAPVETAKAKVAVGSFSQRLAAMKAAQEEKERLESKPSPIAVAVSQTNKTSLEAMIATFMEQRFTLEESREEAEACHALFKKDNSLIQIWANSSIPLNSGQLTAVYNAKNGIDFVLTGAAGTGKTTAQAAVVECLDQSGAFGLNEFKLLGEAPSIAIVAFTKVAVRNIQKAIRKNPRIAHYAKHCMTIHALLEYEPVVETRRSPETGQLYDVRVFQPKRDRDNPLTLTHLIIEEASMVGVDLWRKLYDALSPGVQIIYLGDINQLTPVFSKPILGYALVKLPVIELKRVYRQALDNPIIFNAHRVLKGLPIESEQAENPRVKVASLAKDKGLQGQGRMLLMLQSVFNKLWKTGAYDPNQDMILLPWNKQDLGVTKMNEMIATLLSGNDTPVYCVQGGRTKWYLAVGDRVLVDKRAGKIVSITSNPKYVGNAAQEPTFCTRDGTPILANLDIDFDAVSDPTGAMNIDYSEFSLEDVEVDETKRAATHIVNVEWTDNPGTIHPLQTSGDFGEAYFQLGYCLTIHKSQGSEWRKVYMVIHFEHKGFLCRELIYTGITRAREEYVIFADEQTLAYACKKQDIQGDSLEAKIAYFNSQGLPDLDLIPVSKSSKGWIDWGSPYGEDEEVEDEEYEPIYD